MVRRRAQKQILERLRIYPAVALVGARQCGKTTLAQSIGGSYFDFELDLVLDFRNEMWAVDVKLTASPTPEDMARLDKTADMIGASRRFLISQTRRPSGDRYRVSCDLPTFL